MSAQKGATTQFESQRRLHIYIYTRRSRHGFAAEAEELAQAGYDCERTASALEDAEEQQRNIDEAAAAEKKAVADPLHRQLQIMLVLLPVINGMILSLIQ